MKFYWTRSYNNKRSIELWACPFCGGMPDLKHIGNDYTKKRAIEIRCTKCRVKRTDATLRHGFEWLEGVAAKNWNQRPVSELEEL